MSTENELTTTLQSEPPELTADGQRHLSMREMMACVDDQGRVRCPSCGRFTTQGRITRDNTLMGPGLVLDLTPRCDKCEGH